ncbi:hypothetical protein FQR65_LT07254 [Abscondita terminalis]|nr:hypothetical protein FQR65_LT07254 [Abscondita terminalis]
MNSYTFYCVLLICFNQIFTEPNAILDQKTLDCAAKLNVDKYIIDHHMDENYRLAKGLKDVGRYIRCIMESHDVLQENGEIVIENMYKGVAKVFLPIVGKQGDRNAIAIKISDECVNTTGDDIYDRVINIHNCLVEAVKKY